MEDPELAFDGVVIVGRQVGIAGGRLDLLGLDPSGRWIVVEIKAGKLYRDVIAQALDYVASVRRLPTECLRSVAEAYLAEHPNPHASERLGAAVSSDDDASPREVAGLVVGTARDPGLERLIDFLATENGIAIDAVTFEVFGLFTIFSASERHGSRIYSSGEAFEEFFPNISADEARRQLGPDGLRELSRTTANEFISDHLFGEMPADADGDT